MKGAPGKKLWLQGVVAVGVLILAANEASLHSRAPAGATTLLRIEPEHHDVFNAGTRSHAESGASGGGFISIDGWDVKAPDYGRKVAGETAYPFEVSVPGTYFCWVRAKWQGTCSNSVTMAIAPGSGAAAGERRENRAQHLIGNDLVFNEWHWVRGPSFELKSGRYVCLVGTRESQPMVDCIVLTVDERFDPSPSEVGTAAAPKGAAQDAEPFVDNFTSGTDRWMLGESEWLVVRRSGLSAVGPLRAKLCLAQARTVPVQAARVECAVQLSPRVSAGVFFGKGPEDDYFVARLCGSHVGGGASGKLQICHQAGDTVRVLAETQVPSWSDAQWELLTVWFCGEHCRVYLTGRPVLEARLPRDATGNVGLYADGRDSMLRSFEVPARIGPRSDRSIALADFQPLPEIGPPAWPGLIVPLPGDEWLILRWTNLARAEAFAKRVELVRGRADGTVELLGERWGIFGPELRSGLSIDWSTGEARASVGGSVVATSASSPAEDVGGLVTVGNPRAMFGDFAFEPLRIEWSKASTPARTAADERVRGPRNLEFSPFGTGVLTASIPDRGLPFAWVFDLDQNGVPDTLGIAGAGSGRRVWLAKNGRTESRLVEAGPENRSVLQACFDFGEFRALVNGRPALYEGRRTFVMKDFKAIGGLKSTRTTYTSLSARPPFLTLGYGWPPAAVGGREMLGDAMVQIRGRDPDPHGGSHRMQLHAARRSWGSGYEVEWNKGASVTWTVWRNGAVIGNGTMERDDLANLRLYLLGSVLTFDANRKVLFRFNDPSPLRSGYVNAMAPTATDKTLGGVSLQQPWDRQCMFNQEVNALASMALWTPRAGDWTLAEDSTQYRAYLRGRLAGADRAVLEYRGPLQAPDFLAEIRLYRTTIRKGHRLSVVMGDRQLRPRDAVVLEWPDPSTVVCTLRRAQATVRSEAKIDRKNPAPVFTILRTRGELRVYVDYVLAARMERPHEGAIERLWLELEAPSGEGPAIPAICVQENPLAPQHLPEAHVELLAFLDYVARQ
ncbi:MAG: hypothetical protein HY568_00470 [Candidatus Latescibacteria bacterium]|nr:hypothetical protein [Candidatus Latescibacterota bacterium]